MYIKRREAPANKERGQLLWRNNLQAARVRAGRRPMAAALLGIMLLLCLSASPRAEIWPLPRHMSCVAGSGPVHPGLLAPSISVALTGPGAGSSVAALAAARYQLSLRAAAAVGGEILRVDVAVAAADDALDARTNYTYELSRQPGSTITGTAASPFAVAYALESVLQLSADTQQRRRCATFSLSDSPRFAHRGLLVDTGRRFYPVPMLEALLDAMAAVKLNVLHLYLSEECFRVESKRFPQLTASNCTVEPNFHYSSPGYYTQQQVRSLVLFARLRGIRLLPEIDLPAHSAGICAGLRNAGIVCCGKGGKYGFGQILDDQHGQSVALVQQLLAEISELFPESLFHVGADETGSTPPCTHDNTRNFERKILRFVSTQLDKTPVVWEEALFESGAVNLTLPHKVIIDTWQTAGWQQAAVAGYNVVASREPRLYLDYPEHSAAAMWYDLLNGSSNPKLVSRLLGAEVSMWSDRYVPRVSSSLLVQLLQ
jgi:hexosaminidase